MTTILFTTHSGDKVYPTTIAGFARDIANGTAAIKDYAEDMGLGAVGLYLPNGKTFWIMFLNDSTDPRWRSGFYRITDLTDRDARQELQYLLENRDRVGSAESWHTNGNSHGLIAAYIQAYVNELGENDGYWQEDFTVKYS